MAERIFEIATGVISALVVVKIFEHLFVFQPQP